MPTATLIDMSDALVVGGGPAGLASAIALRLRGYRVDLFDSAVPPIDKACGEGLMPDSLAALRELGVRIPAGEGFPFRGICFTNGELSVTADFPNGLAIGLRRTVLHKLLTARAQDTGVGLHWGVKHVRLNDNGITVDGRPVSGGLVVGADGQNSLLRREAGLNKTARESTRFGFRRHYRVEPWSDFMQLHWGKDCQLYVTPIAGREVGIALLSSDPHLRVEQAITRFPALARHLHGAEPVSAERGSLTVFRRLRCVSRNNVVLVGDASGSVDAVTGEGMCLAFRQALALAHAADAGNLRDYQKSHRKLSRTPGRMASLMLRFARHHRFHRRSLATLAKHPDVFAKLLAVHLGHVPMSAVCDWNLLSAGLSFLSV